MWLDRAAADGEPFAVAHYLADVTERQNERQGYSISGTLGDYQITAYSSGISFRGSLAKYFLPSNIYTLTRQQVDEALQMMSDQLHIDVTQAEVRRLDLSTALPTNRPPADYYPYLGQKPRFARVQSTPDTLYYSTGTRRLIFYDKTKEAAAKGAIVPPSLVGCNLFRYELRFLKQPHKQLKQAAPIQAATLYNPDFYLLAVQRWRDEFRTIAKIHKTAAYMEKIKKPSEAATALFARLMQQQGGQSVIDGYIADLKAAKAFADPKYYTRLKSDLNRVLQTPIEQGGDLIKEIEQAIENFAQYAR